MRQMGRLEITFISRTCHFSDNINTVTDITEDEGVGCVYVCVCVCVCVYYKLHETKKFESFGSTRVYATLHQEPDSLGGDASTICHVFQRVLCCA